MNPITGFLFRGDVLYGLHGVAFGEDGANEKGSMGAVLLPSGSYSDAESRENRALLLALQATRVEDDLLYLEEGDNESVLTDVNIWVEEGKASLANAQT